ncbi:MAG: hypothetical protein ACXWKC_06000 [Xanthobacteraceae bacterium]
MTIPSFQIDRDERIITVRVPLRFEHRGGRRTVITPAGAAPWAPRQSALNNATVKALARAHRWRSLLENGTYNSLTELASAEKINLSYVCRVLRLTLLSPQIVQAILDGTTDSPLAFPKLLKPFPSDWSSQEKAFSYKRRVIIDSFTR